MANTRSVFGSIKEKLGLEHQQPQQDTYDEYDEYSEYDEYEENVDAYVDEDPGYSTRTTGRSRSFSSSLPHLVSRSDAEESTRSRSIPLTGSSYSSRNGRTMVDSSLPPSMTPEGTAAVSAASNRRSEGLDSLFSPTSASSTSGASSLPVIGAASQSVSSVAGRRQLQVIRPASYEDAEQVTQALKRGEVAVLVLTGIDNALTHRLLDFSFGAASALGAGVECIADKTFVICCGDAFSEAERINLQTLGII